MLPGTGGFVVCYDGVSLPRPSPYFDRSLSIVNPAVKPAPVAASASTPSLAFRSLAGCSRAGPTAPGFHKAGNQAGLEGKETTNVLQNHGENRRSQKRPHRRNPRQRLQGHGVGKQDGQRRPPQRHLRAQLPRQREQVADDEQLRPFGASRPSGRRRSGDQPPDRGPQRHRRPGLALSQGGIPQGLPPFSFDLFPAPLARSAWPTGPCPPPRALRACTTRKAPSIRARALRDRFTHAHAQEQNNEKQKPREAEKPQDTEKSGSAMVSSDYAALLPLGLPDIREFRVALPYLLIGGPDLPAYFRRQLIPPAVVHSPRSE